MRLPHPRARRDRPLQSITRQHQQGPPRARVKCQFRTAAVPGTPNVRKRQWPSLPESARALTLAALPNILSRPHRKPRLIRRARMDAVRPRSHRVVLLRRAKAATAVRLYAARANKPEPLWTTAAMENGMLGTRVACLHELRLSWMEFGTAVRMPAVPKSRQPRTGQRVRTVVLASRHHAATTLA